MAAAQRVLVFVCTHGVLAVRPSGADAAVTLRQARDLGSSLAAATAQLEAAPLLRRLDLAADKLASARGTLAPRGCAASDLVRRVQRVACRQLRCGLTRATLSPRRLAQAATSPLTTWGCCCSAW